VPVTKNFRTCFKMDSTGRQILGLCIDDPNAAPADAAPAATTPAAQSPTRVPAAAPKTAPVKAK
jgi:hypothetical protein